MAQGDNIRAEIVGLESLARDAATAPDVFVRAVRAALYVDAEQLMTRAKYITPVDEGVLRSSGHVQLPVRDGDAVEVRVGFGGPAGSGNVGGETNSEDVGYALIVHEDLTASHTVGQAKFLEAPFVERQPGLPARIAERINQQLSRGKV